MKSFFLPYNTSIILFVFSFLTVSFGWAQGWENFDNSNATTTYKDGSFIGNNGISWEYQAARDENNDANGSGIDGKALMLRRASDTSRVYAENIPNGISDFSVKLYKGFTSSGNRKVELFINGISYGQSDGFDDFEEHVFEVSEIDLPGDFNLEIRNITSNQVIVDDIYWTAYDGAGMPPSITDITQTPSANNVTSSDPVSVSANISASSGIQMAELQWGLISSNLTNSIEMVANGGNLYVTENDIPAQSEGTTVYFEIVAKDNYDYISTTSEYSYTVFEPLWLYLPFFNKFRDEDDLASAIDDNFEFNGVNLELAGEGYMKMGIGSSIVTPPINFSRYGGILTYFDLATWGGIRGQQLTVFISDNNGDTYTLLNTYEIDIPNAEYGTFAQYIDLSGFTGRIGRIKYEMTGGSASIRFRDLLIEEFSGYLYNNGWHPNDPSGISTEDDDIFVLNGIVSLTDDTDAKHLFIERDAILYVEKILNVHGYKILIEGDLIFMSTETGDGQLAQVQPETQIRGDVTVERYMSHNRAYRMVSSSVTTSTTVRDNWQEGVNNTSTDPAHNQNPNPGYGTHITGSTTGARGFDATITGESSMFEMDVLVQEFIPVENTDENTLKVGRPYLLFVRGDRSIDLTNNEAAGETILRARGKMVVGNQKQAYPTMNTGDFAMFGNPYQCVVDVKELFTYDSEKINTAHYYVHDPNLGDQGAYVTVSLATGTNSQASLANQYLQPGQAAQFITVENGGPELIFKEDHKAPGNHTATNRRGNRIIGDNMITLQLFTTENYNNGGPLHDGFGIVFDPYYNNAITPADALKPMNFYENFGIDHEGTYLSLEQREMPVTGDIFPLYSVGYQHTDYTIKLILDGFEDAIIYLDDHFTESSTLFETGEIAYSFEVDGNNPLSTASDRFSIRVEHRLAVVLPELVDVKLYPNPISGDRFNISFSYFNGNKIDVTISDILGREVYKQGHTATGEFLEVQLNPPLKSGIYFVSITIEGKNKVLKLINQ